MHAHWFEHFLRRLQDAPFHTVAGRQAFDALPEEMDYVRWLLARVTATVTVQRCHRASPKRSPGNRRLSSDCRPPAILLNKGVQQPARLVCR